MTTIGSLLVLLGFCGLLSSLVACVAANLIDNIMGQWWKPYAAGSLVVMSAGLLMMLVGRMI